MYTGPQRRRDAECFTRVLECATEAPRHRDLRRRWNVPQRHRGTEAPSLIFESELTHDDHKEHHAQQAGHD